MEVLEVAQQPDLTSAALGQPSGVQPFGIVDVVCSVAFDDRRPSLAVLIAPMGEGVAGVNTSTGRA